LLLQLYLINKNNLIKYKKLVINLNYSIFHLIKIVLSFLNIYSLNTCGSTNLNSRLKVSNLFKFLKLEFFFFKKVRFYNQVMYKHDIFMISD